MPRSAWWSSTCACWTSSPAAPRRSTPATGTTCGPRPRSSRTPLAGWLGSPTRPGSRSAPAGRGPAPRSSVPRSPTRAATTWPVGCCTLPTPGPPRQGVSGHDRPAASGLLGGRGLGPLLRLGQREPLRRLPAQPHRAVRPLARSHGRHHRGSRRVRDRRVPDHQVNYGDDPDPTRLICQVTLASFLPMRLGSPWWSWTTYLGREWSEPEEGRHAALASLRLRWPLPVTTLPRPQPPARPGQPNLRDAKASVRALVDVINQAAGPVLAKLEGGERR